MKAGFAAIIAASLASLSVNLASTVLVAIMALVAGAVMYRGRAGVHDFSFLQSSSMKLSNRCATRSLSLSFRSAAPSPSAVPSEFAPAPTQ